ncbi:hypothetical protein [Benzoatithermus flavus]|uniref:Uncharacterized protein n=1 Tax=Benzoatithermus flavus TaxID=3108223 RepID=A0ABU8Y0A0_9PROT
MPAILDSTDTDDPPGFEPAPLAALSREPGAEHGVQIEASALPGQTIRAGAKMRPPT